MPVDKDDLRYEVCLTLGYDDGLKGRQAVFVTETEIQRILQLIHAREEAAAKVTGDTSDGWHTFDELYHYRMLYNALLFNEWANMPGNPYDVHLSYRHSDGQLCFGKEDYFVVVAETPTGQITNHYKGKYRSLFGSVPEKERANPWDGASPSDVARRMEKLALQSQLKENKEE